MMTRRHVDEFYTAYLEDSLPEDARRRVEAHLAECPRCASALEEMRALVGMLHAMPAPEAQAGMAADVRERLKRRAPRPLWPVWATAGALAAALIVAVAAPLWQHGMEVAKTPETPVTKSTNTGPNNGKMLLEQTPALDTGAKQLTSPRPPRPATGTTPVTIAKDPFAGGAVDKDGRASASKPEPGRIRTGLQPTAPAPALSPGLASSRAYNDSDGANAALPTDGIEDDEALTSTDNRLTPGAPVMRGMKNTISEVAADPAAGAGTSTGGGDYAAQPKTTPPINGVRGPQAPSATVMLEDVLTAAAAASVAMPPLSVSMVGGTKARLRVNTLEAGALRVTAGKTEQRYDVKPPETVVTLDAAAGATYQLSLTTGATTNAYYLLLPERTQAKVTTTATAADRLLPALEALRRWTTASGYALLAPRELVKGEAALSAPTLDALQGYAAAHDARAELRDGVATLSPAK